MIMYSKIKTHPEIEVRAIIILKEDMLTTVTDSAMENTKLQHTWCARLLLKGRDKKCTSKLR